MRTLTLLAVALLCTFVCQAQRDAADSIEYYKGGIIYMDMKLRKPKDVGSVLLKNPDAEVKLYFDRYKNNSGAMKVFSVIGGFGLGYSAGTAIGGGKINPAVLGSGAGALLIGLIFNGAANKNLRLAVNRYNQTGGYRPRATDQAADTE